MTKQSKNTRLRTIAKSYSKARQEGKKGPTRTESKHGKKNAWWQKFRSYSEFIKGGKKPRRDNQQQTESATD